MVELAVLADTHVPSRAREVPGWVHDRVRAADHTVHAGDFDSTTTHAHLADLADGDLTAVKGNVDPPGVDLPRVATAEFGGLRFVVTHGTGSPRGYEDRVAEVARDKDGDVAVAGHVHRVIDRNYRGVRLLNPGSATGAPPADRATMMTVSVEDGDLSVNVERH